MFVMKKEEQAEQRAWHVHWKIMVIQQVINNAESSACLDFQGSVECFTVSSSLVLLFSHFLSTRALGSFFYKQFICFVLNAIPVRVDKTIVSYMSLMLGKESKKNKKNLEGI